jgi:rhodanese-related sulfurtransferase
MQLKREMTSRPELIDPEVAHEYAQEGRAQLVDARPRLAYQHSRERIPGAIAIEPDEGAASTDALLALPRERLMIMYCEEPMQAASAQLARRARALGLGDAICSPARWRSSGSSCR